MATSSSNSTRPPSSSWTHRLMLGSAGGDTSSAATVMMMSHNKILPADVDEMMAGLSSAELLDDGATSVLTASYFLSDGTALNVDDDNNIDDEYMYDSEETVAILMELHRDPLQELEEYLIRQETSFFSHKEEREDEEVSDERGCSTSIDNTRTKEQQECKDDDDHNKNGTDYDDDDFGEFQSADLVDRAEHSNHATNGLNNPEIIAMTAPHSTTGNMTRQPTAATTRTMPAGGMEDQLLTIETSRGNDDDDDVLVSPLPSTADLDRQPLSSCRSSESTNTSDLLAQAEAVVRATTLTSLQHHPQRLTPTVATPLPFATPLRSPSPREDARVSPPSAQVRRQQQQQQQQSCLADDDAPKNINNNTGTTTRLSLRLPVDDLSSLLGRFIFRRQRHFQNQNESSSTGKGDHQRGVGLESIIEDLNLPECYYKPPLSRSNVDDTIRILRDMPWQHVDDWDEWDDAITQRLCHFDDALKRLQAESLNALVPHRHDLDDANQDIHDAEQSLRLARLYWDRSNDAVEAAHSDWLIYQTYQEEYAERAYLKQLADVLHRVQDLVTQCQQLVYDCEHFAVTDPSSVQQYGLLIEKRQKLLCELAEDGLENVACLADVKRNVKALPGTFRARLNYLLQRFVARSCRGNHEPLLWHEYSRLVHLAEIVADDDTEAEAQRWADTIYNAMLFELDRCLVMALLEPEGVVNESDYDLELRTLFRKVNDNSGDTAAVRSIADSLVLIRFDLEMDKLYLPRVVRALCIGLANSLYRFRLLKQWHRCPVVNGGYDEESLDSLPTGTMDGSLFHTSIEGLLEDHTPDLWHATLSVVANCFKEYLNFSPNKTLFKRQKNGLDDSLWKADLIDLFECVNLAERMISLKDQVCCENDQCSSVESEQALLEQVTNVIRRHLRLVQVEAMNSLGRTLSKESWSLVMFSSQCEPETTGRPVADARTLIQKALEAADPFPGSSLQSAVNQRWQSNDTKCNTRFAGIFDIPCCEKESRRSFQPPATSVASGTAVEVFLDSMIRSCDDEPRLASSSLSEDVLDWFARLCTIVTHLKLVTEDTAAVFANITDLYITTVLRICSGGRKAESIMLGEDLPSAFIFPKFQVDAEQGVTIKTTPLFGSFRKSATLLTRRSFKVPSPADLHADICSPLPTEKHILVAVKDFVFRAQRSLDDIVNLDMVDNWLGDSKGGDSVEEKACLSAQILMKREAAIMSSVVLSYVLAITVDNATGPQKDLNAFQSYARTLLRITLPLAAVTRKISTARSLNCAEIVKEILLVGEGWDEPKLHENANGYVDEVSDLCALLWGYLNASGKIPNLLQATVWHSILHLVYVSFVEGFSRITHCSTEGRSLMSLDIACLAANLNRRSVQERCSNVVLADLPPEPNNGFNRMNVDTYIKAFYLPVNDAMQWIAANAPTFHMNHSISLIVAVALSSNDSAHGREATVRHLVEEVKLIYRQITSG